MSQPAERPGLDRLQVWGDCLPEPLLQEFQRALPLKHFARRLREGFPFYRSTFWVPQGRPAAHVVERVIEVLREAVQPSSAVVGVEWWFSVMRSNATPQWLLPCHFDRADLDETDPARIRHPEWGSVLFLNAVPYGELAITDQVLGDKGQPTPHEPQDMRFVPPAENRYAVFPGQLYHGVIGRMWRPWEDDTLRVTMAVNWWTQAPTASYLRDSSDAPGILGFAADKATGA
ncbi:MAG: hypothetical protein JNJ71_16975 [Rubrivivax sp.]|nr:hypothetical protein [Rubrivivax sp.]